MNLRASALAAGFLASLAFVHPASAATFKWANDGDANSMDPYTRSETFLLTFTQNIYDPLVRRDRNLKVEPALAESWSNPTPTTWRFKLRQGVKFQGGEPFTADDVVFSYKRATGPGSQLGGYFQSVASVEKVDDNTVDFHLKYVEPIFLEELTNWVIMSKAWCEAHNATQPANLAKLEENFATRNADGTGPFVITLREPDRRTNLKPNPTWWDKPEHNLTEVQFNVIGNPSTRVAALLSGDVDMVYTVPPQDMDRIAHTDGMKLLEVPELRTVFIGFDQSRDELLKSDVKGKNPFKDQRVREAFNRAIDIKAIQRVVMRGQSHPTGNMYGPGVNGYQEATDIRYPYDVAGAKKLLAEAGYPNGFAITLDCPNDRYVNDESICQSVTIMLTHIGIKATLNSQNRLKHFADISAPNYNTSLYMLGWTPNTYDAHNSLFNLAGTANGVRGIFNDGHYSNPNFDALLDKIAVESDKSKRQAMIDEASAILHKDAAFMPLHQQVVVWAARNTVEVTQLADDSFPLRFVHVK